MWHIPTMHTHLTMNQQTSIESGTKKYRHKRNTIKRRSSKWTTRRMIRIGLWPTKTNRSSILTAEARSLLEPYNNRISHQASSKSPWVFKDHKISRFWIKQTKTASWTMIKTSTTWWTISMTCSRPRVWSKIGSWHSRIKMTSAPPNS